MPCQQFWCIFQVKYLSNNSSSQYSSKVILDEFCELFPLHLIRGIKQKLFQECPLRQPYWRENKSRKFSKCPKPNFDFYVISFICTNFEAFTTFSSIFRRIRRTMSHFIISKKPEIYTRLQNKRERWFRVFKF